MSLFWLSDEARAAMEPHPPKNQPGGRAGGRPAGFFPAGAHNTTIRSDRILAQAVSRSWRKNGICLVFCSTIGNSMSTKPRTPETMTAVVVKTPSRHAPQ